MSGQYSFRPAISPVANEVKRPLWSVMIPTYNCAAYLRETLASVLAQDPGPDVMQIIVVDDHSTKDDPGAVVEELGQGRVEFYRQPQNVGVPHNFQTCLELARGELVHLLHGDDLVKPNFYEKMGAAFTAYPEIGAAFCRHSFINERGEFQYNSGLEQQESGILPSDWLERIASVCRLQTPSIAVRRAVYEHLGGFDSRLSAAEDWELWVRISAHYPVWYEVEPLAAYRQHSESNTGRHTDDGSYAQKLYDAIAIFTAYLPTTFPHQIIRHAQQNCAFLALETAESQAAIGNMSKAVKLIQAALKYSPSFQVVRSAARILLQHGTVWLWKTLFTHGGYKTPEASKAALR